MADTLPNVALPGGAWVDLYAATGITVGDAIFVENHSHHQIVRVCISVGEPDGSAFQEIGPQEEKVTGSGNSGVWAWSQRALTINVGSL